MDVNVNTTGSIKHDSDTMYDGVKIISSSDNNKRKRNSAHNDDFIMVAGYNNSNNDHSSEKTNYCVDSIALLEALITPNFEELARQFVEFRHAYHKVLIIQRQKHNHHNIFDNKQQQQGQQNNNNTTYNSFQSCITQEFTIALTKALLHVYFNGLSINFIPNDQLCPPVPNRYYFVQWIQTTLLTLSNCTSSTHNKDRNNKTSDMNGMYFEVDDEIDIMLNKEQQNTPIVGIDIGTGSTCIYPLLFTATSLPNTIMYATDIDEVSIKYAQDNLQCNPQYSSKIQIALVLPSDRQRQHTTNQHQVVDETISTMDVSPDDDNVARTPLTYGIGPLRQSYQKCFTKQSGSIADKIEFPRKIDFCMTNPPFYDSTNPIEYNEVILSNTNQRRDGRQRTVLKVSEGLYPGGEVAFIIDIMVDGLYLFLLSKSQPVTPRLPPPPVWSCCMIGKRTSQIRIQHILEQFLGYGHVQTTEFGPGQLTRWFIAWTFAKRPHIRSPSAKIESDTFHGNKWYFIVDTTSSTVYVTDNKNDNKESHEWNPMNEVLKRIQEYCTAFSGHNLCSKVISGTSLNEIEEGGRLLNTIQKNIEYHNCNGCHVEIWEERTEPLSHPWPGDEILPMELQNVLETSSTSYSSSSTLPFLLNANQRTEFFIPYRGHFLIDMTLDTVNDTDSNGMISVQIIASYRHSTYGMKMIQVIRNQLEGEICRTNRKWRRKLQKHQRANPHEHVVQPCDHQQIQTMDES
jgi:23S rRNA A1618 N6-methylase RlmF